MRAFYLINYLYHMNTPLLDSFDPAIREEILSNSSVMEFQAGTEVLKSGQYVKVVPLVIDGLIKVSVEYEDKDFLLYYIEPNQSCVMSFMAGIQNEPSSIRAVCEENTKALLLPTRFVSQWIKKYPALNELFIRQYNVRYLDLLNTINHILFQKMDQRLWEYLQEKQRLLQKDELKVSHRQIATDLGTAREVISRVMKKLEHEGKLVQKGNTIKILEL